MPAPEAIPGRAFEAVLSELAFGRRLARVLAAPGVDPEDLLQAGLLRALQHPPEARASVRPWFASVLRNLASNQRRSAARRDEHERRAGAPERAPDDPAELQAELEGHRRLATVLAALEEPYRSTIVRRFYQERSCADLAQADGVPESTVRSRLARGIELLRARLDTESGGRRAAWLAWLAPLLEHRELAPRTVVRTANASAAATWVALALFLAGMGALAIRAQRSSESRAASMPIELAAAPRSAEAGDVVPGTVRTTESASRDARTSIAHSSAEAVASAPPSNTAIRLRAVDGRGGVVPSATLTLDLLGREPRPREMLVAKADSDGNVLLPIDVSALESGTATPTSGPVWVALTAPGHCSKDLSVVMAPGEINDLGEVVIAPAGDVRGRVVDRFGAPIASRIVELTLPHLTFEEQAAWPELVNGGRYTWQSAVTDAHGEFAIVGVETGVYRAWSGGNGWSTRASAAFRVSVGETTQLADLVLVEAQRVLRGVVVDEHGAPALDVRVDRRGDGDVDGDWDFGCGTGADGLFAFEAGRAGNDDLHFFDRSGELGGLLVESVEPSSTVRRYVLPAARRTRFTVRDEDGAPVTHFEYCLILGRQMHIAAGAVQDESGSVEVVLPAAPFELRVVAEGRARGAWPDLDPARLGAGTVFTLALAPVVQGRLLDEHEAPAAGLSVRLEPPANPDELRRATRFPARFGYLDCAEGSRTDADGRFQFTARCDGSWSLVVTARDRPRAEFGPFESDAFRAGTPLELRLPAPGAIEGRLLTPPGVEAEGCWVGACFGNFGVIPVRLGRDGTFRFRELAPGRWWIHRLVDAHVGRPTRAPVAPAPLAVDVVAGNTTRVDLDLRTEWTASVIGNFRCAGVELHGWTAAHELAEPDPWFPPSAVPIDAGGRFELRDLAPGKAHIALRDAAGGDVRRELSITVDLLYGERRLDCVMDAAVLRLEGWDRPNGLAIVSECAGEARMTTIVRAGATSKPMELVVPAGRTELHELGVKGLPLEAVLWSAVIGPGARVDCVR
ncbi:MAG: sigma-70 family RNA polymerase sigma factor [Planctomycetes bacterium]|nr:sigma-70 family RNA polymerase sigma factor [Planctomycetota bacterium]